MIPDSNEHNFYLSFIYDSTSKIYEAKKEINNINDNISVLYKYIVKYKSNIDKLINANLDSYEEFSKKIYNTKNTLYNKIYSVYIMTSNADDKYTLERVIKYCNSLYQLHIQTTKKNKYEKYSKFTYKQYDKYVTIFFNKVHEIVLKGYCFKLCNILGPYGCNRWKRTNTKKKVIDFAATNARKKELLALGVKLYNKYEAEWYKFRHIPYDGIDYRIYQHGDIVYDFTFMSPNSFTNAYIDYKRTETIIRLYRGLSYKEIADKYTNTIEDIYNLQVDIKYKLNMILYKYPEQYKNFIRDAIGAKYKVRVANS